MFHSQGSLKINENEIVINTSPTKNDERPNSTAPVNTIVADAESGNSTPIATEDALFRNPSHHHGGGPSPNQDVVARRKMKQSRTAAVQSSLYCGSAFLPRSGGS
jgi:hypothetical protein